MADTTTGTSTSTVSTTPPAKSTGIDSKQTANNIVKGIHDRASGKSQSQAPEPDKTPGNQQSAPDPNAGKDKYIVEGKEIWLTPDQAKAYVQKGLSFDRATDQLGRLQQEQSAFLKALVNDPGKVLSNLAAHNKIPLKNFVQNILSSNASDEIKDAVGQWYYENAVEPLKLTPEQLKARENEKRLTEYEKQEKHQREQAIRQQNMAQVEKALSELKAFVGEAMKESGLPSNDTPLGAEMARQVADVMRVARYQKKTITPKQAIEFVKQRIKSVQSAYYETLEDEDLAATLGETVVSKIQKFLIKKAQANAGPSIQQKSAPRPTARNGERKTITPDDMQEYLDSIKKTGSIPK